MNIAYVMRGIPGSGKSTLAKILAGEHGVIHSTDDYFYKEGRYVFDRSKLKEYHDKNFSAFCTSLEEGKPIVICDNTNVKKVDAARYLEAATRAGYLVASIVMPHPTLEEALVRNMHNLDAATIQEMIDSFED
jgi:predicted kinase